MPPTRGGAAVQAPQPSQTNQGQGEGTGQGQTQRGSRSRRKSVTAHSSSNRNITEYPGITPQILTGFNTWIREMRLPSVFLQVIPTSDGPCVIATPAQNYYGAIGQVWQQFRTLAQIGNLAVGGTTGQTGGNTSNVRQQTGQTTGRQRAQRRNLTAEGRAALSAAGKKSAKARRKLKQQQAMTAGQGA
jgi:hypothetical protein